MPALWLLAGCGGGSSPWWMDELVADSPCYRVDLLNGVDEGSTAELHDLFACLDQDGQLAALRPLDDALDVETRSQAPIGAELARVVDHLPEVEIDPFALVGVGVGAVVTTDLGPWLDLSLELVYGVPASEVRAGEIALADPDAIGAGVLAPLAPVVTTTATTLLDDDLAAAAFAGELVADPGTERWIRTFGSVMGSEDPALTEPIEPIVADLADAILLARTPEDDRWSGASGDSLRDVVDFFVVQDRPVVDRISPSVAAMMDDAQVRAAIVPTIDDLQSKGHIAPLGAELAWLASVDIDGTALEPNEPSAVYRFVRLLATNNKPAECLGLPIGNVAVTTLELIAEMPPGQVQDLAAAVSDLRGLLEVAALTCPSLTPQTLEDLGALEVITEPEAFDLLSAFVAILAVLHDGEGQKSHLPEFADLATELFESGAMEPAEELIRDWGTTRLSADVAALVPALVHPEDHGITAGDGPPATLDDAIDLVVWVFAVDPETGLTGSQRLRPWAAPLFGHDGTWQAVGAFATVASDPRSTCSELPSMVPELLEIDPDLVVLDQLGPLLGDRALAGPLLRIAERDEFTGALLATSAQQYGQNGVGEVPLGFWSRLVVDGVLDDVLRLVHSVLGALGAA